MLLACKSYYISVMIGKLMHSSNIANMTVLQSSFSLPSRHSNCPLALSFPTCYNMEFSTTCIYRYALRSQESSIKETNLSFMVHNHDNTPYASTQLLTSIIELIISTHYIIGFMSTTKVTFPGFL